MTHASTAPSDHAQSQRGWRSWVAGIVAGTLIAGGFVAAGVGIQAAAAEPLAPRVSATPSQTYIAGEDVEVQLRFTSAYPADSSDPAAKQYNLSAAVTLSADVTVVSSPTLGTPKTYQAGAIVRGLGASAAACVALGLEAAPGQTAACRVPAGAQYLVFENISDLPAGAGTSHSLTLRPKADTYPAGSSLELGITAFTSGEERLVPGFPGATGTTSSGTHTSAPGRVAPEIPVNAVRIEKSEPSPEGELLRGVHTNSTTYTLRVSHTGEGDLTNTRVVDYLPAGLEYLGAGGTDHSTAANGTRPDGTEYDGSGDLAVTPAPEGGQGAWSEEESVETVALSAAEAEQLGLAGAGVYTKVTWNIGQLLGIGDPLASTGADGVKQGYSSTAGQAGYVEIRYRAAVPLFENTLDFGYEAATDGQQGSNLDNNRGRSTRHGIDGDPYAAQTMQNAAIVTAEYAGVETSDSDTASIDAVDVRLLKSVNGGVAGGSGSFEQGELARYALDISTSEYVGAAIGERPQRLVDDLGDGLCPVFPSGTAVADGSSTVAGLPNLLIGDPSDPAKIISQNLTANEWAAALQSHGVATDCAYPSPAADASSGLVGAALEGIGFDPQTGHFFLRLALNPADALAGPNQTHRVQYSAAQNESYVSNDGKQGATSSGDLVTNTAALRAGTTSIPALDGVTSASGAEAFGENDAWDDSQATLKAALSGLTKSVLKRSAGVPDAAQIQSVPGSEWVKTAGENDPFVSGDEVWYHVRVDPPAGADIRNPRLTDFLPVGTRFDESAQTDGRYDDIVVRPASDRGLGSCSPATPAEWLDTFVPNPTVQGQSLTWLLGSADCSGSSDDRFFPIDVALDIYIKVTITDVSAFGEVDLPDNLAKYQQENVNGEIFFLRDAAAIEAGHQTGLLKGILTNPRGTSGNGFNSNVDGEYTAQQDEVRFRVDLAAPEYETGDYVVWDALPVGITKHDFVGAGAGAPALELWDGTAATPLALPAGASVTAYDPGDPGRPATVAAAYAERTIVVWNLAGATVPADPARGIADRTSTDRPGLSLQYSLRIPDESQGERAALVGQRYVNDASIVSYDVTTNADSQVTHIVESPISTARATAGSNTEFGVGGDGTHDPSFVELPNVSVDKQLVSTEIAPSGTTPSDANNGTGSPRADTAIVQGELAVYDYTVTIPARTSVRDGLLTDDGVLRWTGAPNTNGRELAYHVTDAELRAAPWLPGGTAPAGFSFDQATGDLAFPSAADGFYNATDAERVFTVRLTGWIEDADASHPNRTPDLPHAKQLRNTAGFTSADATGGTQPRIIDTADVNYLEPFPTLSKSVIDPSDGVVSVNGDVKYRLTAGNGNAQNLGRPALYSAVVLDCVPADLRVDPDQFDATLDVTVEEQACRITGSAGNTRVVTTGADRTGTLITWNAGRIDGFVAAGNPVFPTLEYRATVVPDAGGGARLVNGAQLTGTTLPDRIGGESTAERRGDRITGVSATVHLSEASIVKSVTPTSAPVGASVEYTLKTTLPARANFYDATLTDTLPAGVEYVAGSARVTLDWAGAASPPAIADEPSRSGSTLNWAIDPADIRDHDKVRTITVTFSGKITTAAAAPVRNTGTFTWNTVNDDAATKQTKQDRADVTLLDPVLAISKKVDGQDTITRNPDASFEYTLNVTNTGRTPAHHIAVTDRVPAGVKVDADSITPTPSAVDAGVAAGTGGVITWQLAGPLDQQSGDGTQKSLAISYSAKFVKSGGLNGTNSGLGDTLTNTASVVSFTSFATDGREYRPSDVRDTATVTPVFPKIVLEKTATGGALARVGEPFDWTLKISNNGLGDAQTIEITDVLPANWSYVEGSAKLQLGVGAYATLPDPTTVFAAGGSTLTWSPAQTRFGLNDTTPVLPGAARSPLAGPRTATITYQAIPTAAAVQTPGVGVGVHPHVNTLAVLATDTDGSTSNHSGNYVGAKDDAQTFLAAADLEIQKRGAAKPLSAGTTGTGWTIAVQNNGPDTSEGSITVTDTTQALPTGVVVTGASGDGWTCSVPNRAANGVTDFSCARTDTTESLANGASFPTIAVAVKIAEDQAPVTVQNTATVHPGRTYDPKPENNESTASFSIVTEADLAIVKTAATALPTAGASLSWTLAPRNIGPSISVSTAEKPIRITDTVPAGMIAVADPSTASWKATVANAAKAFPATAGDTITWTYTGASLAVGAAPAITLTGTIDPNWVGGNEILNATEIVPGATTDPKESNNTSEATVTPGDRTSLGIAKVRVVNDGGVWKDAQQLGSALPEIVAGESVNYRIIVANNGPAAARNVHVVDTPPAELTFESVADENNGAWTQASGPGAGQDTFTLSGNMAPSASRSFIVTYAVDSTLPIGHDIVNWVQAFADNSTNEPKANDTNVTDRQADLAIAKSHTGDAVAGQPLAYQLVVTNNGPSTSSAQVVVTDTLPAGFSYVADTASLAFAGGAAAASAPTVSTEADGRQTLVWSGPTGAAGDLAIGETIVIDFTVQIAETVPEQHALINEAWVEGPEDKDPTNNYATDPVDVATQAEMTITKDVAPGPWVAGTDVSYTLTVRNDGPSAVQAAVRDLLPAGISLVSITGSEGWNCDDAAAACVFPLHPVGVDSTITVIGHIDSAVPTGTELVNTAELSWTDSRGGHEDDDDAAIVVETAADLVLEKSVVSAKTGDVIADPATAIAGETARFGIAVRNDGPSDVIAPLTVVDELPAGTSFVGLVGDTAAEWAAAVDPANAQLVTFTRVPADAGLAMGVKAPAIVYDVLIDAAATTGAELTNTATVSSGTPELNADNNTDTAQVLVQRTADLGITKSHDAAAVRIGDPLEFTINVTNSGPSLSSGARVVDTVPAGLTVVSAVGDAGNDWIIESVTTQPNGTTEVVASRALPLAVGEQAPALLITTEVTAAAYAEVVNVATVAPVDPAEQDPNPKNDRAEDPVTVPAQVTLITEKTAVGAFQVGKQGTFRITVENRGPTADPGPITVTDALPRGLTFHSSPDDGVVARGSTVTWTLADGLAVGERAELTLVVNVAQGAYPEVTNVVTVTTPSEVTPNSKLTDDATARVAAADGLAITGSSLGLLAALAVLLLGLGGVAAVIARRRTREA
ncbi:putative repeat protein (TIGR01451 family)/fimbrial isopeptide formation D2 family protein [Leucobacter luti]|uniref:Putative repeat protein (TIGR01451 family)/fimbrial isopeptide formation D2 family protein n=1 Tax=Leucobacter luti TaxID=340320 RepID=A0A4R6RV87_9MICO|nr:isopeptide-forming domain-containing fimbrial protein [Leucobacter luti]TDP90694.1 putative repeat protein (TIGR01451 family)/fimbrial isopeptide formation D2 family protein [Leucobacter luti]